MPVFIFLVLLAAAVLCLFLSSLYRPLGSLGKRLWDDAVDAATKEDDVKVNEKE